MATKPASVGHRSAFGNTWEEFGFLSYNKLCAELNPDRRASGPGKSIQASRWSLALPAELRDIFPRGLENRGRFYDLYKVARREVKAERLAAGLTVDASNYERRQRIQMELGGAGRNRASRHQPPMCVNGVVVRSPWSASANRARETVCG